MATTPRDRSRWAGLAAVALVSSLLWGTAAAQDAEVPGTESVIEDEVSDTITITKSDGAASNADLAVRISEVTVEPEAGTRVLIGRDDEFADAMASAVLQDDAPLLLVPRQLPLPESVVAEIDRLDVTEAVILGGSAALSDEVGVALEDLGLAVQRRQGLSRFETATDIAAQDAVAADTAILARAFPDDDATDPTQAFADSIAAGGMSAESGWPILLTQTEVLTGSTRDYLAGSAVRTVMVVGGTAAVSEDVVTELSGMGMTVERIAGDSRADTAVAVAEKRGASSSDEVGRTLLVEGFEEDAWVAGFASAGHSAEFDAPIVLSAGDALPPETAAWLGTGEGGETQGSDIPVLACATRVEACERARERLRLPPRLRIHVRPAAGSEVQPGQLIGIRVEGLGDQTVGVRVPDGGCAVAFTGRLDAEGRARTTIDTDAPAGPCRVVWRMARPGGTVHSGGVTYVVTAPS